MRWLLSLHSLKDDAMSRPFDFDDRAMNSARLRQQERCACCGEALLDLVEHAHHVVPNQSGDADDPDHAWLREPINCVILCETCHYAVHDSGRYRHGPVAPADYYEYSHGRNRALHELWVETLRNRAATTVWAAQVTWKR
jgi:hypothetical protein